MHKVSLLVLLFSLAFFSGCSVNPITGKKQLMLVPSSQEINIGKQYAPVIEKDMGGRILDHQIQNYVSSVGAKIAAVSHMPGREFSFIALNDKSVNAMALPDGTIFITRGMLEKMSTEAQLASVLGHEVAHVTCRHVSNAMSKQIGTNVLLSIISSKTEMTQTTQTLINYSRQIINLRFSRDDEHEADAGGLNYTLKAGYNPYGMVEVMEILDRQNKTKQIEFLSSHPLPARRKQELRMRVQNKRLSPGLIVGKEQFKANITDKLKNIQ